MDLTTDRNFTFMRTLPIRATSTLLLTGVPKEGDTSSNGGDDGHDDFVDGL